MRKYIRYIFIFVFFLIPLSGNSLELCKIKGLDETDNDIPYCNITNSSNTISNKKMVGATISSPYYNANDEGLVTPIKNQYNIGACWAFSAVSTVESNALKNGLSSIDLSEAHLLYGIMGSGYDASDVEGKKGKYNTASLNMGGTAYYAASYFFNNGGQLLESEYAYPKEAAVISSANYPAGRNILSVDTFEILNLNSYSACSTGEISAIKQKIIENGSIVAFMYINDNFFSDKTYNYYLAPEGTDANVNHGITIVGWDDNISKSKFKNANRDGAWIVKNSYGTSWSGDGYFYISYDDNFVCKDYSAYSDVNNNRYDYTRKSADLVSLSGGFVTNGTLYVASHFDKTTTYDELIKKVSFGVPNNASYNIYISKNNFKSSPGDWILLGSGHSDSLSIRSIYVPGELKITKDFTIIVEIFQDDNTDGMYPTMCNYDSDFENVEFQAGVNYIGYSTNGYVDLYQFPNGVNSVNCEPLIYVYSDSVKPIGINITDSNHIKKVNNKFVAMIDHGNTFTTDYLKTISDVVGKDYIKDKSNNYISRSIGTGSKIYFNDNTSYDFILKGDTTGDGTVNSADLLRIVKHLKKMITLNETELIAADATNDNEVNSGDLMKIVKYLKGMQDIIL